MESNLDWSIEAKREFVYDIMQDVINHLQASANFMIKNLELPCKEIK